MRNVIYPVQVYWALTIYRVQTESEKDERVSSKGWGEESFLLRGPAALPAPALVVFHAFLFTGPSRYHCGSSRPLKALLCFISATPPDTLMAATSRVVSAVIRRDTSVNLLLFSFSSVCNALKCYFWV